MTDALIATSNGLYDARGNVLEFGGRDVFALSPDGDWAIVDRRELWRNSGSWELAATSGELDLHCVASHGGAVFAGSSEAHLFRWSGGDLELVESFENVEGRERWFTPWGGPPDVRSIAAGAGGELYVNVHVGGIVKGDGAASWEPTLDISADVHEVKVAGDRIVAACAVGLAESGDGGYAWSYDDEGLHETYARAIAVAGDVLLMSVSEGPRGGDAAIYSQPLDGSSAFRRCDLPSFRDNIDTGCLEARGASVMFGTKEGDVFHSPDAGLTWSKIAGGLPPIWHVALKGES